MFTKRYLALMLLLMPTAGCGAAAAYGPTRSFIAEVAWTSEAEPAVNGSYRECQHFAEPAPDLPREAIGGGGNGDVGPRHLGFRVDYRWADEVLDFVLTSPEGPTLGQGSLAMGQINVNGGQVRELFAADVSGLVHTVTIDDRDEVLDCEGPTIVP